MQTDNPPGEAAAEESDGVARPGGGWLLKGAVLAGLLLAIAGLTYFFGDALSLQNLAARETELRQFQASHPVLVYGIAFLIYVSVTGLSLPGAAGLTLLFSWYFGFPRSLVLISFASTTGATLAFLLSRYLFRDTLQRRFGDRLAAFNRSLEREGAFYLFSLRLIPVVPFFIINAVMGLTPMRPRTFWWVSQLGMLPGTAVYVYAGSSVPNLSTLAERGVGGVLSPQLLLAFVLLGVFPLAVKKIMQRFRPAVGLPVADEETSVESATRQLDPRNGPPC
ncbi:TVP38/TMEM64 family protein [Lignipirellula cremea]|uniref:TVP38/TMEM64 family membrane protein n=1 Tax=Lignipirellula cremea TaxID=2528010 RepID=A0A518E2T4_9BACT|nr:TVP38/TMEM64 family protein [Lignipirellula cremea]QDU98401.1 TVP38/TMEM64 family inner membrane protein YdjZ [Lignipirellula cremea]